MMNTKATPRSYRIDPNFVPREPTPANFFGGGELPANPSDVGDMIREGWTWMSEAGAKSFRATVIDRATYPEHTDSVYPDGLWLEGWIDELANQLPFGGEYDGVCWPGLTAKEPAS